jgi:Na+/H+ antiporter NhaD/arsenite permease-like protein
MHDLWLLLAGMLLGGAATIIGGAAILIVCDRPTRGGPDA